MHSIPPAPVHVAARAVQDDFAADPPGRLAIVETRDVLWTGGWDSTFRVLMLALQERVPVRPHYLIDPERRSTDFELRAIDTIRAAAVERGGSIEPVRMEAVEHIAIGADAAARHQALVRAFDIGPQYLWLSEYARQQGIDALELCIHVDDKAYAAVRDVSATRAQADPADDPGSLFRFFSFPVLETSKVQMWQTAHAHAFDDLMEQTWFCHLPTRAGRPCGFCSPCRWTIGEGLTHRLSRSANFRRYLDDQIVSRVPSHRLRFALRHQMRAVS